MYFNVDILSFLIIFIYNIMSYQYQSRETRGSTNPQNTTSQRQTVSTGNFQTDAINQSILRWSSVGEGHGDVVIHSESDIALLKNLKNILLGLQSEFVDHGPKVVFAGEKKDDFNKRLILLEGEIEGLLKRRINYSARDEIGGTRYLDYTGILNEKQTQIVELEKKINNLEQRLRRASERELELENHIAQLYADLKVKESIILAKNDVILAEVAASNKLAELLKQKGGNIPAELGSFDIRADALTKQGASGRSGAYGNQSQSQKYKTQLIQVFREFERLNNQQGINDGDIERVLEGFLVSLNGTRLKESVELAIHRRKMEEDYQRIKDQFGVAVGIFQGQIDRVKKEGGNFRLDMDPRIFDMLKDQKITVFKTSNDIVHLERFSERTVEVPVQDARTKHLMHMLAVQMKKFTSKYPKLLAEMDVRLTEFFQQQLIDIIEVDELDRVVEIVKYQPQVVKVENVYAYSSEKSRKVEFHLRVLVKALLEELEKLKRRTGAVLEIDEGIIGMINQQIMGVVDVDDILKVFRVVPKIVEVEKIVQKIVDRIVEVPQFVPVEKIVEKIVEVEKIKEIERVVNIPLEVPTIIPNVVEKIVPVEKIVEKIVEVPQIIERVVEVVRQVPKVVTVDRVEQRPVEIEKVIEVQSVRNHIQTEIREVQVIVEKVVVTEKIVKEIVEVPVIVEKIIEKVVEIPKIIEVERVVEKVVETTQHIPVRQISNHIEVKTEIVDRIIEKPIPIIQTVQKIIEVPQIVEKIVTVENVIREPYEVEIIKEKIVVQDRIKEIERIIEKPVEVFREVVKQVEKIIEIPVIHERLMTVQEIVEKPVVQRIENTIIKEVYLRDPIIVHEPKTIEVEKIVNHYIDVPKPVKYIEQKIVEVVKHVDRIKEVRVPVEKVIEKMVEVPKVVQVEKIVEKVVVVPRVVEKVVEVPQIVERVVPKVIIEQKIKEVERTVQVPVFQDKVVEIEVPKNVYVEVEKIIEKIVDKLVEVPKYEEKIINNDVIVEKVIEVIREVPRDMEVEKIVYNTIEVPQIVEVERQIVVPVEVPIPVEKVVEKMVPITETIEKIVQVPQVIEKIIDRKCEIVEVQEVVKIEQKIVVETQIKEVVKQVPYINEKIVEVPTVVEKVVPVQTVVQDIVTAQQIVEKVVEKSTVVPKVYEVERIQEKVIEVPKIMEVEKIIPQLVNVNRYIQNIVEKIVEVPVIVEQVKEVVRENEKIVQVRNDYETVKEVEAVVEKAVVVEKFKEVVRNINHIEKVLQIVDRFEQTPVEILVQEEKLVEVPYILEKIVEKIVVMPQIVEVLKYVHEVTEKEELGVAVGVDVATHEQRLKILTKDLKVNFDILLAELRKLKTSNPNIRVQIELIEKFLAELEHFILYPKIFKVPEKEIKEVEVIKDRLVTLPTQDERSIKMELTLSLLVEKLILELKRIKKDNPNVNLQLEEDVKLIFFEELGSSNIVGGDLNAKLKSFADSIYRKFEALGSWSFDHQMMLNSFLQERFLMANLVKNANLEIEKAKAISIKGTDSIRAYESEIGVLQGFISKIRSGISGHLSEEQESILGNILRDYDSYVHTSIIHGEPVRMLGELAVTDQRIQSLIRQKDEEIFRLRDKIFAFEKGRVSSGASEAANKTIEVLRGENLKLKNEISALQTEKGSASLLAGYREEIAELQARNLELEQTISNLTADLANYKKEHEVGIRIYESNVKESEYTRIDPTSGIKSEISSSFYSPSQKYDIGSPDHGIKMVESSYRGGEGDSSRGGQSSSAYQSGMTDSQRSGTSAVRQEASYGQSSTTKAEQPNRSTYGTDQRGSYGTDSRIGQSGYGGQTSTSAYGTAGQSGSGSGSGSGTYGSAGQTGSGSGAYGSSGISGQSGSSGYSGQYGTSSYGQQGTGSASSYGQQGAGNTSSYGSTGGTYGTGSGAYRTSGSGAYRSTTGTGDQTGQSGSTQQSGQSGASGSRYTSSYGTGNQSSYRYGGDKR